MPKPAIGDRAMTDAKRQRRRRECLRKEQAKRRPEAAPQPPGGRPSDDIAAFKARIRELEAQLARECRFEMPNSREELAARKQQASEERKAKRAAMKAVRAAAQPAPEEPVSIESLTTLVESLTAQLTKARTEIKNSKITVRTLTDDDKHVRMVLPKGLRRQILGYLHPDKAPQNDMAAQKRMEKTFQAFNALKCVEEP